MARHQNLHENTLLQLAEGDEYYGYGSLSCLLAASPEGKPPCPSWQVGGLIALLMQLKI
jgi:hypothetical protein